MDETEVITFFATHEYAETEARFGISHGALYRLVARNGARKHEGRIRQRKEEQRRLQSEYLEIVRNQPQRADVHDFLRGIPDESVSLTVTSPPYNVGRQYGSSPTSDAMRFMYYTGWMRTVLSEVARVTKPGGTICLQVGQTKDEDGVLRPLDSIFEEDMRRLRLRFQTRIVWVVPHGLTPARRLAERYETILVFSKGDQAVFNPDPARQPQKHPTKRAFKGPNQGNLSGHPFGAWPTNVWEINSIRHNHPEKTGHPAQFPEDLARRAVLLYSMPGDVVLDPFVGAGTTAVVCRRTGREFIGCDLVYGDEAAKRAGAATPDASSRLPGVTAESVAVWEAEARRVQSPAQRRFDREYSGVIGSGSQARET